MSSADLKQQANAARAKEQQMIGKIGMEQSKLNGLDPEDSLKISTMQNKIEGLKANYIGARTETTTLDNEARAESSREAKEEIETRNKEQEAVLKEEIKNQQKIEKDLAEKAELTGKDSYGNKAEDFGDDLKFLNDDRDFNPNIAEDVVDFSTANPASANDNQAIDGSTKSSEDEKQIKATGASAAGA